MSMPEAGQAAERDERGRDDYEQQQARVLVALMQSFCAARYRKADNTPCPIEQGLYLGSVGAALNKEALKSLNITHILIVARSLSPAFPAEFNYKKIEVLDSPDTDLLKHFDECFSFIDEAISSGGNVLVHCFAGRSRSVTIVVAYLMKKHQMSLESALSLVRSKRPQVAPNEGFISQLENFDKSLQGWGVSHLQAPRRSSLDKDNATQSSSALRATSAGDAGACADTVNPVEQERRMESLQS
ncbi:hypothetical protein SETIT_J000700v2 [Setaria italica]|uniref:Uncharacterized protein n=2 Tax=Setaria italica TaxID=4555 RepID=A0A368PG75_SETIT|nr:dual specificity protein phosphatase 1B isoform X1 [Setaria italica]RCU61423.1 hypothetical protein SETIT_J000700v2 [Setaria italica]